MIANERRFYDGINYRTIPIFGMLVMFGVAWGTFELISYTAPYSLIVVGALLWWFYNWLELGINGETSFDIVFTSAQNDFLNNVPGGYGQRHRMKLTNFDMTSAAEYPGEIHCVFNHIFIPLLPLIIWWW